MAEATNARSARFLTMPTVVECCGVRHCGEIVFLSILYGELDSILCISLCSYENSNSPPRLIVGNHTPDRNIDRKFHHGRFTLVLEAKLGSSNITCALRRRQFHIVSVWEFWSPTCPSHLRRRDRRMGYSD